MHFELDHFLIFVSAAASEAQRLIDFGLCEGAPNRHPGQGTANRRFFFHNAFLELVWVEDPAEAQCPLVARTGIWDRWSGRTGGASPFGICLRPSPRRSADELTPPPFATWVYRPPYLPDPLVIQVGTNSELSTEPLLFYITFNHRPDSYSPERLQPLDHPRGLRQLTRLRVSGTAHEAASAELRAADLACPWLSMAPGDPLAELGFDGEVAGKSADFRPLLPLVLHW